MSPVTFPGVVGHTKKLLGELTGLEPVEVTGLSRDDQGWHVRIEMLEFAKIPPSADVIAEYDVLVGGDGSLVSFQRTRSRLRAETIAGEAV